MKNLLVVLIFLGNICIIKAQIWSRNLNDVYSVSPEIVWILAEEGIIYKTTDGGSIWNQQYYNPALSLNRASFLDEFTGLVIGSNGTILKTTDGGINWIQQTSGITSAINNICFLNNNSAVVVGDSGYILKTTNGGLNWVPQESPSVIPLMNICFKNDSIGIIVGGSVSPPWGTILKTTDGGTNWYHVFSSNSSIKIFCVSYLGQENWIAVDNAGRTFKSSDDGTTWVLTFAPSGYPLIISDMHFFNDNTGVIVGAKKLVHPSGREANIWRTTDGGVSWIIYSLPPSIINAVSFTGSTGYIAGSIDPGIIPRYTFYKSTDQGFIWNGMIVSVELTSFIASAEVGKIVLNWTTATEKNNRGFEVERRNSNCEFITIGFVNGNGTTTETKNYTYIDTDINLEKYFYRLKQFDYNGSFEYSEEVEVVYNIPTLFSLSQNYPNPFNPSTTIEYTISEKNLTTLKIYDITGQLVSTLVNQVLDKGSYSVNFNPVNLPCGIYFYELHSGNNRLINKMCLIK